MNAHTCFVLAETQPYVGAQRPPLSCVKLWLVNSWHETNILLCDFTIGYRRPEGLTHRAWSSEDLDDWGGVVIVVSSRGSVFEEPQIGLLNLEVATKMILQLLLEVYQQQLCWKHPPPFGTGVSTMLALSLVVQRAGNEDECCFYMNLRSMYFDYMWCWN